MSDPINIRNLAVGARVTLGTGAEVEIISNPQDGVWLFARYLSSADDPAMVGQEDMIFAQDVVEVRSWELSSDAADETRAVRDITSGRTRTEEPKMPQVGDAKRGYRGTTVRDDAALNAWLARRPAEAALEPNLPIIDPHHHFWDSPHRGHYLLPELLADIGGGHNIVSTVFLECRAMYRKDGPREMAALGEVEFVTGIAAISASGNYGRCRVAEGIVGGGDLSIGAGVRALLEAEIVAAGGRLRGMRHGVAWDANEAISNFASRTVPLHQALDPRFREGFAQLAPLGLSFESWQYHPQLQDAIDLAHAFPDTTIILNHVGGVLGVGPYSGRRQEILTGWRKDTNQLAKCPNVCCKLGGIGMVSFGFDFHERDVPPSSEDLAAAWRQYIEPCIEAFGVDRCMFESNFPPDKQSSGYTELWNAFKRITANASASEKTALYSGTAARVYRLTAP